VPSPDLRDDHRTIGTVKVSELREFDWMMMV
jgi:hypothetical protein